MNVRMPLCINADVAISPLYGPHATHVHPPSHETALITRLPHCTVRLSVGADIILLLRAFSTPTTPLSVFEGMASERHVPLTLIAKEAYPALSQLLRRRVLVPAAPTARRNGHSVGGWTFETAQDPIGSLLSYRVRNKSGRAGTLWIARTPQARRDLRKARTCFGVLGGWVTPILLDAGQCAGGSYLVVERVAGLSADEWFAERLDPVDESQLIRGLADIIQLVANLERVGIVHGSFSATSVLFDNHGRAWINDVALFRSPVRKAARNDTHRGFRIERSHLRLHRVQLATVLRPLATPRPDPSLSGTISDGHLSRKLEVEHLCRQLVMCPSFVSLDRVAARLRARALSQIETRSAPRVNLQSDPVDNLRRDFGVDSGALREAKRGNCGASLAHGAAGIAYAFWRTAILTSNHAFLEAALEWIATSEAVTRTRPKALPTANPSESPVPLGQSIARGWPGIYFAKALIHHAIGDEAGVSKSVQQFCAAASGQTPSGDLYWGSLGASLSAHKLAAIAGADDTATLFARSHKWAIPLRAQATSRLPSQTYLGFAHGLAGQLFLAEVIGLGMEAHALRAVLNRNTILVRRGATWPIFAGTRHAVSSWCNGTAGHLLTWLRVWTRTQSRDDADLVERIAWGIDELPTRLNSLCCGAAGQAIVLARCSALLDRAHWKRRAALLLESTQSGNTAAEPTNLLDGHVGILLAAIECRMASQPDFPIFGG